MRHPELAAARANRDYAYKQVCDAIKAISDITQASGPSDAHPYEGPGELAAALDELDVSKQAAVNSLLSYSGISLFISRFQIEVFLFQQRQKCSFGYYYVAI